LLVRKMAYCLYFRVSQDRQLRRCSTVASLNGSGSFFVFGLCRISSAVRYAQAPRLPAGRFFGRRKDRCSNFGMLIRRMQVTSCPGPNMLWSHGVRHTSIVLKWERVLPRQEPPSVVAQLWRHCDEPHPFQGLSPEPLLFRQRRGLAVRNQRGSPAEASCAKRSRWRRLPVLRVLDTDP